MKSTAILFSGQGVLARDIRDYYLFLQDKSAVRVEGIINVLQRVVDEVNPEADFRVRKNLEDAVSDVWSQTAFVQPVTYALSVLTYELIKNKKLDYSPAFLLGHSLGAFSALTAAGALTFEMGIRAVTARGKYMQEESERGNNGMCAVIGLSKEKVDLICKKTNTVIALINAPTAFVLGGSRDRFYQIEQEAAKLGARKTIHLETSGAFHTRAMQGAYERFKHFFSEYSLKIPRIPVVTNMGGTSSIDPDELKNDVIESMVNPVNWVSMMSFLKNRGVESYIEAGPGTSLSALARLNGIDREQIVHAKDLF